MEIQDPVVHYKKNTIIKAIEHLLVSSGQIILNQVEQERLNRLRNSISFKIFLRN